MGSEFALCMIIFKDMNDTIPFSKDSIDDPWHEMAIVTWEISALDTPNLSLFRSKEQGDSIYDTLEHLVSNIMMLVYFP